jgi:hypothetical protein
MFPGAYHSVTPHLSITEAAAAIEFYKKAFRAKVEVFMGMPDGRGRARRAADRRLTDHARRRNARHARRGRPEPGNAGRDDLRPERLPASPEETKRRMAQLPTG